MTRTFRDYPFWVRVAFWPSSSPGARRSVAWWTGFFAIFSVTLCLSAKGFWTFRFFEGLTLFFGSIWSWLAIRWIDRHGEWLDED